MFHFNFKSEINGQLKFFFQISKGDWVKDYKIIWRYSKLFRYYTSVQKKCTMWRKKMHHPVLGYSIKSSK